MYTPYGEGIVLELFHNYTHPIGIQLKDTFNIEKIYVTSDGRLAEGGHVFVSQTPLPEIKNTPLPEIAEGLKHGDSVWVRDSRCSKWDLRVFRSYCQCENTPYLYDVYTHDGAMWESVVFCEKFHPETVENYRAK